MDPLLPVGECMGEVVWLGIPGKRMYSLQVSVRCTLCMLVTIILARTHRIYNAYLLFMASNDSNSKHLPPLAAFLWLSRGGWTRSCDIRAYAILYGDFCIKSAKKFSR